MEQQQPAGAVAPLHSAPAALAAGTAAAAAAHWSSAAPQLCSLLAASRLGPAQLSRLPAAAAALTDPAGRPLLQPAEAALSALLQCARGVVKAHAALCVGVARAARALRAFLLRAFPAGRVALPMEALYRWLDDPRRLSRAEVASLKYRMAHTASLWAQEDDCRWWEENLPRLHISSVDQLAALHRCAPAVDSSPQGKHACWALALAEPRGAKETKMFVLQLCGAGAAVSAAPPRASAAATAAAAQPARQRAA